MLGCAILSSQEFLEQKTHSFEQVTLLTFSLLISEDFWLFLDFPSDRSIFSTFLGGSTNAAIAEKREEKP